MEHCPGANVRQRPPGPNVARSGKSFNMRSGPGFIQDLSRPAWVILGDCLSAVGSGLTLPFFLVYLHHVRNIDLRAAALALVIVALAGLVGNPTGGSLVDRFGARYALLIGLLIAACGAASLTLVHETWQAFLTASILGFGSAVIWPAQDSLLAIVVAPDQRSTVFSATPRHPQRRPWPRRPVGHRHS